MALPEALRESSGVAVSRARPGVFWSHNDSGGQATIFALDSAGAVLAEVPLEGAQIRDWEDMAWAPCGSGGCLYVGDTGDNDKRRSHLVLYRLAEPSLDAGAPPARAEAYPFTLPDGPRDIEALFVLPGEAVHFVTKGGGYPVEVYRYPPPLRPDTVVLERVQFLSAGPRSLPDQVTGADADSEGRVVAIRTYRSLRFYRVSEGRLSEIEGGLVNLQPLQEAQGEAVALGPDGLVVLTSEAGPMRGAPSMAFMQCQGLPGE